MSHLQHLVRANETALRKTASYYVMHIAVASCVAYAVTGSWTAAMALGLLEPSAQAIAYFLHEKAWARAALGRFHTLLKSLSYYLMHLVVAAGLGYVITGNWIEALTLSLLEPTVQMVFFYIHEKVWEKKALRQAAARIPCTSISARCMQESPCRHTCLLKNS